MEIGEVLGIVGFFFPLTCCIMCFCSRRKKTLVQSSGPIIGEELELEESIPPYTIEIQPPDPNLPQQPLQLQLAYDERNQSAQIIVNPMQLPVQNQIQQQSPEVYFIPPFVFPTVYEEEPPTVAYHSQTDDLPVYESIDPPSYAQAIRGTLYENRTNNNSQS